RRTSPITGRWCGWLGVRRGVLQPSVNCVSRAPNHPLGGAERSRLHLQRAEWSVLHPRRLLRVVWRRRSHVRDMARERRRRRDGAGNQFLPSQRAWAQAGAIRVLQEARNARAGGRATGEHQPTRVMARPEITTPEELTEEGPVELSLRPQRLSEFIGQQKVKDALQISLDAALARREPLDHTLFFGPPGLGKTTLAELIARELGVNIRTSSGPALEKPGDLVATLTNMRRGDILFIDEIHRLKPIIEEFLYPAMEDYKIDIRLSEGPKAQTIT